MEFREITATHRPRTVMPPDVYITVTTSEETIANLSRVMASHDLESISSAIDYGI